MRWCVCVFVAALAAGCGGPPGERATSGREALLQCPVTQAEGIDVSQAQGAPDWAAVAASGVSFAWIKATQGTYDTQRTFADQWAGAGAVGIARGAYHFFDPTEDGAAQALHFLAVVGPLGDDDLAPMVDVECPDGDANCLFQGASGVAPAGEVGIRLRDCLQAIARKTGRTPVLYTFRSYFASNAIDTAGLASCPLFLAAPTSDPCIDVPAPWARAIVWQYDWTGVVPGIVGPVDRDRLLVSLRELRGFGALDAALMAPVAVDAAEAGLPAARETSPSDAAASSSADVDPDGSLPPDRPPLSSAGACSGCASATSATRQDVLPSRPGAPDAVGGCAVAEEHSPSVSLLVAGAVVQWARRRRRTRATVRALALQSGAMGDPHDARLVAAEAKRVLAGPSNGRAMQTTDIRKGIKIQIDGVPYAVVDHQFVKPGKGQAFTRARIKNLTTGAVIERTWKSGESVELADVETRKMSFSWNEGDSLVFMDTNTGDQIHVTKEAVGDEVRFISEGLDCEITIYNGNPIGVELPSSVVLQVAESEPGVKGDTASGATKPAKVSTGAVINVPLFIKEGEWVKVDTRTGDYLERVNR